MNDVVASKHESEMKEILGKVFLRVKRATAEQDLKLATDYVIEVQDVRLAVRIRDEKCKFRDFTLRASRPSGAKVEKSKIGAGHATHYFYAWSDGNGGFKDWMVIDLSKLRDSGLLEAPRGQVRNVDGSSSFAVYAIAELREAGAVIANSYGINALHKEGKVDEMTDQRLIEQVEHDLLVGTAASYDSMLETVGIDRRRMEQNYGIEDGGLVAWAEKITERILAKAAEIQRKHGHLFIVVDAAGGCDGSLRVASLTGAVRLVAELPLSL